MHKFFAWIGEFSVKFRWAILAAWIIGLVGAVAFGPSLNTQSDNSQFLPAKAPSQHAINLSSALQPKNSLSTTVIVSRASGLTSADSATVSTLIQNLQKVEHVADATISPGGNAHAELINVTVTGIQNGPNSESDLSTLVKALRSAITATPHDSGFQMHVIGSIADQVDNAAKAGNNNGQVDLFSILAVLIILFLIYRAILAPFITLLPAVFVVGISQPLVAVASHHGLQVSSLATILMIVLVIGAGTDYGLFLVFRVREEIENGLPPKEAVAHAVARVGESIAFSAGTVIAALLSLLAASFGLYNTLGVPLAIGIGTMLVAGLTLTPALLAIFGRAVFWPKRPKAGAGKIGLWGRIAGTIVQKPVPVLLVGVVVFGALATFTLGFKASGFGDGAGAPAGTDSAAGEALQKQYFQGQTGDRTSVIFKYSQSVWDDPAVVENTQQQLAAQTSVFTSVSSPLQLGTHALQPAALTAIHNGTPVPGLPAAQEGALQQALSHMVSKDGHLVIYTVSLAAGDSSSTAALNATPQVRDAVSKVATEVQAVDSGALGQSTALYDISRISTSDLQKVIPIAIVVIGLLLVIVMRSVVAPLYLIVSVGLSYLAALGTAVLVFITIGGQSGLVFFLPFMMFIFLLALGEDYNILVMTRIREEAHHKPLKEAVRDALNATGTTVTSAGLVLAATFGVFAVVGGSGGGSQIRDLGVGMVVGILMDTFLVRTLLVPSTVILLGKWNWWPSKFSHDHQNEIVVPSGAEFAD